MVLAEGAVPNDDFFQDSTLEIREIQGISQAQRNLTETRDERKFIDIGHTTQVTQKMHHALRFYSCFFMCLVVFLDLVD